MATRALNGAHGLVLEGVTIPPCIGTTNCRVLGAREIDWERKLGFRVQSQFFGMQRLTGRMEPAFYVQGLYNHSLQLRNAYTATEKIVGSLQPKELGKRRLIHAKSSLADRSLIGATSTEAIVVQEGKRSVKFRPCIDIHKGKVKQIVGSTLRDLPDDKNSEAAVSLITNFESQLSAGEFAEMYKNDGLLGGHVIMLGADPASHAAALEALRAYPGGLQVGGGVNLDNASGYLDAGASHVIVTSFVFRDGKMDDERLKQLVKLTGKNRLVLDLSCRKKDGQYLVVTDRWQRFSDLVVNEATLAMLSASADEFLVHGVDVEGKRLGIDDELVSILGRYSPIPVTYAGGVNTLADLERIKAAGNGVVDVTVGSALDVFGGDLPYSEVVA